MQPILDTSSKRQRVKALGRRGAVILTLFLSLGVAQADTTNFMGDFGEAFWSKQPQFGSINFSNSDTEVVLAGPNQPANPVPQSFDGILYNGPLAGGLVVGGTMQFSWTYNSGDALSDSDAAIAWTTPGGSPVQDVFAQGGPGVLTNGVFTTPLLAAGTTFEFLLTTDTLANKLSGTLVITDFQFHDIPEPSTATLVASMLVSLGAARWRRCRRQAFQRQ